MAAKDRPNRAAPVDSGQKFRARSGNVRDTASRVDLVAPFLTLAPVIPDAMP